MQFEKAQNKLVSFFVCNNKEGVFNLSLQGCRAFASTSEPVPSNASFIVLTTLEILQPGAVYPTGRRLSLCMLYKCLECTPGTSPLASTV